MRKLLNTLYITSSDRYLHLDGENVVIIEDNKEIGRIPLHNLESIITFGFQGASPALMGKCAQRGVSLNFMTSSGRFLASVVGAPTGNVLLRKEQYRISDNVEQCCPIAKAMLIGKIYNSKWIIERFTRDHFLQVDVNELKKVSKELSKELKRISTEKMSLDELRGVEGYSASIYFDVFDQLILHKKEHFSLIERTRRPPRDRVNAMLSFLYTVLANDCAAALTSVGLDPFVGFLHRDKPGRKSLALDLMEEFRPVLVDRLVLSLINKRMIEEGDFEEKENGSILMKDDCKKKIISAWQEKKKEIIKHPFTEEKVPWGLLPFIQSQLLARYIRKDLDGYPVFLWK